MLVGPDLLVEQVVVGDEHDVGDVFGVSFVVEGTKFFEFALQDYLL